MLADSGNSAKFAPGGHFERDKINPLEADKNRRSHVPYGTWQAPRTVRCMVKIGWRERSPELDEGRSEPCTIRYRTGA